MQNRSSRTSVVRYVCPFNVVVAIVFLPLGLHRQSTVFDNDKMSLGSRAKRQIKADVVRGRPQ